MMFLTLGLRIYTNNKIKMPSKIRYIMNILKLVTLMSFIIKVIDNNAVINAIKAAKRDG